MRLSTRQLFALVLFTSLFALTIFPVNDPDFWWHLKTGQYIVENRTIPHADPSFAFTTAGKEWVTHEWLAEVLIWGLYRLGGYSLLSLFFGAVITLSYLLVYMRSPGKPYIAGFIVLLAAATTFPILRVRPQMFTLLLSSTFLLLLDWYFEKPALRYLVPLPVLMILWVNLHAGYAMGIALLLAYLLGKSGELVWAGLTHPEMPPRHNWQDMVAPAAVLPVGLLASGLNPNGYRMLTYPFETLTSEAMQRNISEWFSPDFHQLIWQPLALFLILLIALGLLSRRQVSLTNVGLVSATFFAALRSMRNVALFSVTTPPVVADQLESLLPLKLPGRPMSRRGSAINFALLGFIVLVALLQIGKTLSDQRNNPPGGLPVEAVDWIEENAPQGNIFNAYHWGGYLIWRLSPDYPVIIDGRADIYGDAFINKYVSAYHAEEDWEAFFERYGVRIALVEPTSPIARELKRSPGWELVYSDDLSVIYIKR